MVDFAMKGNQHDLIPDLPLQKKKKKIRGLKMYILMNCGSHGRNANRKNLPYKHVLS